jgi:hypothetical protein
MTVQWKQTERGQFQSEYRAIDHPYRIVGLSVSDNGSDKRWRAEVLEHDAEFGDSWRGLTPWRRTATKSMADVDALRFAAR